MGNSLVAASPPLSSRGALATRDLLRVGDFSLAQPNGGRFARNDQTVTQNDSLG